MSVSLLQFARSTWPATIAEDSTIAPVTARRLSDDPLLRIDGRKGAYALRGWRGGHAAQALTATRFVRHLASSNRLCVPVPLESRERKSLVEFQGFHWELAPWLAGEANFETCPSRERLETMCHALALLHLEAASLGVARQGSRSTFRVTQLAELARSLDAGEFAVKAEQLDLPRDVCNSLLQGVKLVQPRAAELAHAPIVEQWVWGDAWHENFLFEGDCVVGMVDFATVRVDTPLADLARLLGSATTDHPDWWQAGLDAYHQLRPLSTVDCLATRTWGDVGTVLSMGNWLRWLGVEHREFSNSIDAHKRLHHFHHRLAELLARTHSP